MIVLILFFVRLSETSCHVSISNKNLNNIQITKALIKIAKNFITIGNNVKIKYIADRPGHDLRYALDGSKLESIGWKPPVPFKESLERVVNWTKNNKEWLI